MATRSGTRLGAVVGAMGIVFGDIATSPLYTLQECLTGPHGVAPTPANVLGCVSLIVWSLLFVVTLKYARTPRSRSSGRSARSAKSRRRASPTPCRSFAAS